MLRPAIGSQASFRIERATWARISSPPALVPGSDRRTRCFSGSAGDRIGFWLPTWVLFLVRPAIGSQEQLVSDRTGAHVGAVSRLRRRSSRDRTAERAVSRARPAIGSDFGYPRGCCFSFGQRSDRRTGRIGSHSGAQVGADLVSAGARPGSDRRTRCFSGSAGDRIAERRCFSFDRRAPGADSQGPSCCFSFGQRPDRRNSSYRIAAAPTWALISSPPALVPGSDRRTRCFAGSAGDRIGFRHPRGCCFSFGQRPDRRNSSYRIAAAPTSVLFLVSAGARPGIGSQNALFLGLGRRSDRIPAPTWVLFLVRPAIGSQNRSHRIAFRRPCRRSSRDRTAERAVSRARPAIGSDSGTHVRCCFSFGQRPDRRNSSYRIAAAPTWALISSPPALVPGSDRRTRCFAGSAGDRIGFRRPREVLFLVRPATGSQEQLVSDRSGAHVGAVSRLRRRSSRARIAERAVSRARPAIGSDSGAHVGAVSRSAGDRIAEQVASDRIPAPRWALISSPPALVPGSDRRNALFLGFGRRSDRRTALFSFDAGARGADRRAAAVSRSASDRIAGTARIGSQRRPTWVLFLVSAGARPGIGPQNALFSRSAGDRIGFRLPTWVLFLVRPAIGSQNRSHRIAFGR